MMSNGLFVTLAQGFKGAQKITDAGLPSDRVSLVAPFQTKASPNRSILFETVSALTWIRYPMIETGLCCAPVIADQPGSELPHASGTVPLRLVQRVQPF